MKTTIDIPEPLPKIRAVEQGTSLKALVLRALEQALSSAAAVTPVVPYSPGASSTLNSKA